MLKLDTSGSVPQLYLYGEIARQAWWMDAGEVISADEVLQLLDEVDAARELAVRINSGGGDVFEGVAIYNALARREGKVTVYVDALAASIASVIAMAGDERVVAGNASIMVHRAWTYAAGNEQELQAIVDALRTVDRTIVDTYVARLGSKATRDEIVAWMAAETWMGADESVTRGFADRAEPLKGAPTAAAVAEGRYKNTPRHLLAGQQPPEEKPAPPAATPPEERYHLHYLPQIAARIAAARARNC